LRLQGELAGKLWQDLSDQCQATAMAALGVERFTALRRQGRALPPGEVVTLAAFEPSAGPASNPGRYFRAILPACPRDAV
jgi:hypothetical protein